MLDTVRPVETPEGVELRLRPAGPLARFYAWLIDLGLRFGLDFLMMFPLLPLGGLGRGLWLILVFAMEWFYPVFFEVLMDGRTPGKRIVGLRVLCQDGTPVGWSRSMVRSLVMFADFLPMPYGTGLLAMLFQRDGRRLGDLAAGTLVVHAERRRRSEVPAPAPAAQAPWAPDHALTRPEQQAIVAFAERVPALSRERAEELADLLEPLTAARGEASLHRLLALAAELRGTA